MAGVTKKISYKTKGVCSRLMDVDIVDGIVNSVKIIGGCDGNLKGICKLVEGRPAGEVAGLLEGIRCGQKATSCPDQLAKAIHQALSEAADG